MSQLASRIRPPSEPVLDGKSDIFLTESSSLNGLVLENNEQIYQEDFIGTGGFVLFISFIFLIVLLWFVFASNFPAIFLLIPFALLMFSIYLIINGKKKYLAKVEEEENFIKNKNEKLKHEWLITANALYDKWKLAYRRWEQCYYCHRDDVVFIPGESNAVPASKLEAYVYKEIDF